MISCVAVTRGGWGDVWGFESPQAARSHPIVQEGDAVVASPEDVLEVWNPVFLPRLFTEVLGDRETDARLRQEIDSAPSPAHSAARCRVGSQEAWTALRRAAQKPPEDPKEIVRRITEDRRLYDEWYQRETTRRTSVTTAQTGTTEGKTGAKSEAAKEKKIAGHAPTAKIAFGKDKDGKSYNATDNNPKRAGSKSGDRFAKYKAGMTLEQAVQAGVSAADIKWDSEHKYIEIHA